MESIRDLQLFGSEGLYKGDMAVCFSGFRLVQDIIEDAVIFAMEVEDVLVGIDCGDGLHSGNSLSVASLMNLKALDSVYWCGGQYYVFDRFGLFASGVVPYDTLSSARFLKTLVQADLCSSFNWLNLYQLSLGLRNMRTTSGFVYTQDTYSKILEAFESASPLRTDLFEGVRFAHIQNALNTGSVIDLEFLCAAFGVNIRQLFLLPELLIEVETISRTRLLFEGFKEKGVFLDEVFGDYCGRVDKFFLNSLSAPMHQFIDSRINFSESQGRPVVAQQCFSYVTMPFNVKNNYFDDEA